MLQLDWGDEPMQHGDSSGSLAAGRHLPPEPTDDAPPPSALLSRAVAVIGAVIMAYGGVYLARHFALLLLGGWSMSIPQDDGGYLRYLYIEHGAMAAISLAGILLLRWRTGESFGLRWPERAGDIHKAVGIALAVFVVFTAVNYLPNVIGRSPPPLPHPLTLPSIVGWSLFQGGWVGPSEEILFRGLIIGYLAGAFPGSLKFRTLQISWATIISAVLFGLIHVSAGQLWWQNAFHATYACSLGLVYGVWMQRSRSLLAPSLAHNATDLAALLTGWTLGAFLR